MRSIDLPDIDIDFEDRKRNKLGNILKDSMGRIMSLAFLLFTDERAGNY